VPKSSAKLGAEVPRSESTWLQNHVIKTIDFHEYGTMQFMDQQHCHDDCHQPPCHVIVPGQANVFVLGLGLAF
jgi:hypothetical protein